MLQITVKFDEPLRRAIGQRRVFWHLLDEAIVADLLDLLAQQYEGFVTAFRGNDLGRSHPYILFINGLPVTPPNFDAARLHDGDVLHLALPVVEGCRD